MSAIALAIGGGALIGGGLSYLGAKKAAKGSEQAAATSATAQTQGAEIAAQSQREALQYLKDREAIPQHLREQALQKLGGLYGIGGGGGGGQRGAEITDPSDRMRRVAGGQGILGRVGSTIGGALKTAVGDMPLGGAQGEMQGGGGGTFGQQDLIDQARQAPLYSSIMGGREAGEESIARYASATGGLRSGNIQDAMYKHSTQLQNQALLQSYNQQLQGLQGLAGLPSNASQIAGMQAGIGQTLGQGVSGAGQTLAQGQVASGQAWQQGLQGMGDIAGRAVGQWIDYRTPGTYGGTIAGPKTGNVIF